MEISNTQDVIDSRDVIERIEELEADLETCRSCGEGVAEGSKTCEDCEQPLLDDDEKEELEALRKLTKDGENYAPDWFHGAGLIHEDYFTEYCEEFCKDVGYISQELPWFIANHIDWDAVANEIKADYTEIDFDGETYYVR